MNRDNSNEKITGISAIESINAVEGFDPKLFAVEYDDSNGGDSHTRLPVVMQMAWFRLKYPEGKIAVKVAPAKDCFVATARVYPNYKDSVECYLAEATASRKYDLSKPSISPREWAQTAAVGIALRNAGFGLQFDLVGDEIGTPVPDELAGADGNESDSDIPAESIAEKKPDEQSSPEEAEEYEVAEPQSEPTYEEKLELAMRTPCPITKYKGKTLGEVLALDPKALNWVATKFAGDDSVREAAKFICEFSVEQQKETT